MDISEIKYRCTLMIEPFREHGVHLDGVILFGSRAKGTHRIDSDYDLCFISRDFGKDRFQESLLSNGIAQKFIPFAEVVPVGVKDYLEVQTLSPILHEIKTTGMLLL